MSRHPLRAAALALLLLPFGCSDQQEIVAPPEAPALVTASPSFALAGAAIDGPAHGPTGAIFTTTPDGGKVNENVKYINKLYVYLDGGPRNDNPYSAALDDGWYIFQVTDPPGKHLLSMDPAKCRVVEVYDGVIQRLVRPHEFGLSDDYSPKGNGAIDCHAPSTPGSTEIPGSGQHEINPDSDPGGGKVVQLMPFGTTPNPGNEYKAWMTTWGDYRSKVDDLATALDAMPTALNGKAKKPCPDVCFEPDPGFAAPRNLQKTDNFKVLEAPPFIRIAKRVDEDRDGFDSDDPLYTDGWLMTIGEPLFDGSTIINGYVTGTSGYTQPIAVPSNTTVTVCEEQKDGWMYSYARVGGSDETAQQVTADNGDTFQCVEVKVGSVSTTIEVAFGNYEPEPKARIRITPQDASNLLPYTHTLTAMLEIDWDEDTNLDPDWEPAPDGTEIKFTILSGPAGTLVPTSCATVDGACSTNLTSTAAGVHKVEASSAFTENGFSFDVKTDGESFNSDPAEKTWIDAKIGITPRTDENGIYEPHVLTATVWIDYGNGAGWVYAPNGLRIDFKILPQSTTGTLVGDYCITGGGNGACTTTLNSSETGTTVVEASTTITAAVVNPIADPDVPADQELKIKTDGTLETDKNSPPATKTWIDGTLIWEKHDAAGNRLGGATFEVCRTHDYFLSDPGFKPIDPDCFDPDILDNDSRDQDPTDGVFKLTHLRLGRYTVRETIPPENYLADPRTLVADIKTSAEVFVGPFIDNLNGRMTGGTGKVVLDLEDGSRYISGGFTIHCDITLSNNIELNWKDEEGNAHQWHITKPIKTAVCIDDPDVQPEQPLAYFDTFKGTAEGSLDGAEGSWLEFIFVDGGEPGKKDDLVFLKIWNGGIDSSAEVLTVSGEEDIYTFKDLAKIRGNIQAHLDQPHGQNK